MYLKSSGEKEGSPRKCRRLLALGERVANLEDAVVGQSHDVAGPCLVNGAFALCHELRRRREAHGLIKAHMIVRLVAQKLAGAHFAESDARTVVGVDVGSNFEDEACELRIIWFHHPFLGLGGLWTGRNLHKAIGDSCTPKLLRAEPKNTGATSALR